MKLDFSFNDLLSLGRSLPLKLHLLQCVQPVLSVALGNENINDDDNNTDGGDNQCVVCVVKGSETENRQNAIGVFTQRGKANEKMGLIAVGTEMW